MEIYRRSDLATAGTIDRTTAIHLAIDALSANANTGLDTHTPRAHADTRSDADTGCAGTNAGDDAHTAHAPLPDTALRRTVGVTINGGSSR
jgi:hypothetical protein